MENILIDRDGTVYKASEYISQIKNIDEDIKELCEMIMLVYQTIPEKLHVDIILSYHFLKSLKEICDKVGIEFDFDKSYTAKVDIGETQYHKWLFDRIKLVAQKICIKYSLKLSIPNKLNNFEITSNFQHEDISEVGMLCLWLEKNSESVYCKVPCD